MRISHLSVSVAFCPQKFVLVAPFPFTSFVLEGMRKAAQMIMGKFIHTATQPAKRLAQHAVSVVAARGTGRWRHSASQQVGSLGPWICSSTRPTLPTGAKEQSEGQEGTGQGVNGQGTLECFGGQMYLPLLCSRISTQKPGSAVPHCDGNLEICFSGLHLPGTSELLYLSSLVLLWPLHAGIKLAQGTLLRESRVQPREGYCFTDVIYFHDPSGSLEFIHSVAFAGNLLVTGH